jgi:DNA repair exonuclease SbcCD ATPase subunit
MSNELETQTEAETQTETKTEKVYPESVVKDLIAQRDSLKSYKTKVEEYEQMIKDAQEDKLKENEDYKTLLDSKEKDLAELKSALENAKQFETKYTELDNSIRTNLLSQLPEEMKEVAEELTTVKLQKFVELHKKETPGMDAGKSGKSKINIEGKKWNDFDPKDLAILKESDYTSYAQLFKARYGINPSK